MAGLDATAKKTLRLLVWTFETSSRRELVTGHGLRVFVGFPNTYGARVENHVDVLRVML